MHQARLLTDGSCELIDPFEGVSRWPSLDAWADAWIGEWLRDGAGPAGTSCMS